MKENKTLFGTLFGSFRNLMKWLLARPVMAIADRLSSAPNKENVNAALSRLYEQSIDQPGKKSANMFAFDPSRQSTIIFSDQHKGARNGADDFAVCEDNYLAALDYYNAKQFYFVNLGDCEEFWENSVQAVVKNYTRCFEKEKLFIDRKAYTKVIGNHDLYWGNDPLAPIQIKKIYDTDIKIFEGITLRIEIPGKYLDIFCTHGHQGDAQSDGNWFSKWFVSYIWGPLQSFLELNINSPATNDNLKTIHNQMMQEWASAQHNVVLITGHTHQPVFNSLTRLERLYLALENAREAKDAVAIAKIEAEIPKRKREYDFVNHSFRNMNPSYFNTGCCCFVDGNITGIEIADSAIRLIKWDKINGIPTRVVAEECLLEELWKKIG